MATSQGSASDMGGHGWLNARGVPKTYLLIPPALKVLMQILCGAMLYATLLSTKIPKANPALVRWACSRSCVHVGEESLST